MKTKNPEALHDVKRQIPVRIWEQGWLLEAKRLDSPNFGPRPLGMSVDLAVIHSISLPPGQFGGDAVQALFTNQLDERAHSYYQTIAGVQVSAHFYIRRTGEILQFVSCDQRAWHAGSSSFAGRDNCNDYSVGIELEGLEGGDFEPVQYHKLAHVLRLLKLNYPIEHVIGHQHIAPNRKFDPGAGFEWGLLQKTVAWPLQCFPVLSFLTEAPHQV